MGLALRIPTPEYDALRCNAIRIRVGEIWAWIPDWLPRRGWRVFKARWRGSRHKGDGYLIYDSRAWRPETNLGVKRGEKAHRAVMRKLLGRDLLPGEVIHHMDFNKWNCCPCNLLLTTFEFNPSQSFRDPYTGRSISREEYVKNYGV